MPPLLSYQNCFLIQPFSQSGEGGAKYSFPFGWKADHQCSGSERYPIYIPDFAIFAQIGQRKIGWQCFVLFDDQESRADLPPFSPLERRYGKGLILYAN
jgi:hypothetical protein